MSRTSIRWWPNELCSAIAAIGPAVTHRSTSRLDAERLVERCVVHRPSEELRDQLVRLQHRAWLQDHRSVRHPSPRVIEPFALEACEQVLRVGPGPEDTIVASVVPAHEVQEAGGGQRSTHAWNAGHFRLQRVPRDARIDVRLRRVEYEVVRRHERLTSPLHAVVEMLDGYEPVDQ